MIGSTPLLSQFLVLVLTLGTLCGPLLGLARLMEAARLQEAKRARSRAHEEARRRDAEMKLAAIKESIAQKFAQPTLGRGADEAASGGGS